MSPSRRVLVVAPTPPAADGSGSDVRVLHIVRHLARRHRVTVLCYAGPEHAARLQRLRGVVDSVVTVPEAGPPRARKRVAQLLAVTSRTSYESRRLWSAAMQREIDRLAATGCDVVQVVSAQMGTFTFPPGCAMVLDAHNIEHELMSRMGAAERTLPRRVYNRLEARRLRRAEHAVWARLDGCATTSERERRIVAEQVRALPLAVVANGVDVEHFHPGAVRGRDAADSVHIVFTGTMNYRPNVDAAVHLVRTVLPIVRLRFPEATVAVCGQGPPDEVRALAGPFVTVTGRVADMRPHLARAAAIAVPLRMGAGTRLKILEALAMGRAVVSTTLGSEGLDVEDGRHLLVADTAEAFAAALCRVLGDRALAARLGRAGRELVERRYAWDVVTEPLDDLHERAVAHARMAARRPSSRGAALAR